MLALPKDVLIHIFSYLKAKDIFALLLTSKAIYSSANDNKVWFNLFLRENPKSPLKVSDNPNFKFFFQSLGKKKVEHEKPIQILGKFCDCCSCRNPPPEESKNWFGK